VPHHLVEARDFIYEHLDEQIDLRLLSKRARLSPFHFLRRFRDTFDETPHACLTRLRLERAKELLVDSELPVTEVCFEVGFTSLGSFSTMFRKHVGHSPLAFRRRLSRLVQVSIELAPPGVTSTVPFCFLQRFCSLDSLEEAQRNLREAGAEPGVLPPSTSP
jgi:AraC-like DNA-binding protein